MNRHPRTSVADIGRVARTEHDPDEPVPTRIVRSLEPVHRVQCTACGAGHRLENPKAIRRADEGLDVPVRCSRCGQRMTGRMGEDPEGDDEAPDLAVLRGG